jgi:HEAT repeat protein
MAAAALVEIGMTGPVKTALLAVAQRNPEIKQQLMGQLLQTGEPEGMRMAEEMLTSKDGGDASTAIYALISAGTPEARRLVDRALTSDEPRVRIAAMSSLAQNPDDRSTDALVRMTRDPNPRVRLEAMSTLGQIGSDRAQQAILDASRSGAPEDRITAIHALGSLEDARAGTQLAQLMTDSDPRIAESAVRAASSAGPEVDRTLTAIVNNPAGNPDLRRVAALQLRQRGTQLDPATEQSVNQLAGPEGGGAADGRVVVTDTDVVEETDHD